jgi:hypothetical protein
MQRYFNVIQDRGGNAILGVSITVLNADGSAPTLYAGNGVLPMASNVLTSNADGEYSFYAANGKYTLTYSGTGYVTESWDGTVLFDKDDLFGVPNLLPAASGGTGLAAAGAAGNLLTSNGTSWTSALPPPILTAPGASGNLLTSDGSVWTSSPSSLAAAGTLGNVLTSNGTAWASSSPASVLSTPGFILQSFGIV